MRKQQGESTGSQSEAVSATRPEKEDADALTVVGLGGSAGSIPALETFLQSVPDESTSAYVVVVHLSPEHESRLAEVLGRSSKIPVHPVEAPVKIKPRHAYVILPGRQLEMHDGMLVPSAPEQHPGARVAIDMFFRTLSHSHGPQSAAVVLSGSGADGALGIRQIKEAGGLVVAQSPAEAEFDMMPRAAIATGVVDYVLPTSAMPAQIETYWETSRRMRMPQEAAPSPEQREEGADQEVALHEILTYVRVQTGHDFAFYKRATVLRRIGRRMQVNRQETLPAYRDFLRSHPAEVADLIGDLLISVTQFFRDPAAWLALERDVVPRLFDSKSSNDEVRAWVCGCATGEEAYTLAMLLLERARQLTHAPRVVVFATDMDMDAVSRARAGIYLDTIAGDLSEERLRTWFYHHDGSYQVRKELREAVIFAHHDVLRDTPFSRLDLITCRNLFIYLNRDAQLRAFHTFHFALRPDRYLMLGSAETAETADGQFSPLDKQNRLYMRRATHSTIPIPATTTLSQRTEILSTALTEGTRPMAMPRVPPAMPAATSPPSDSRRELFLGALERFGPPAALVNTAYEVVHLSGGLSRFLSIPGGEPTHNLLQLIHPALRLELRAALFAAATEGVEQTRVMCLPESSEGGASPVPQATRLTVRPIAAHPGGSHAYFLVVFETLPALPLLESVPARVGADTPLADVAHGLEQENAALQGQLRATTEQFDAQAEELRSANEEMHVTNEEMRSVVEELETGKEELQSVNEELSTVNYELKTRVEELTAANSDLQNFISVTDIATVFLDRALNVRRFTSAALALFNLIPTDVGRPLTDVTNRLDYDQLFEDAERVLARLQPIEREVTTIDKERHFLVRLLPYRSLDDRIEGVVLTFVDVTARLQAEIVVRESEERQAFLLELSDALRGLEEAEAVQAEAARLLGIRLGADRAFYAEVFQNEFASIAKDYRAEEVVSVVGRHRFDAFGAAPMQTLRAGRTLVYDDVTAVEVLTPAEKDAYRQLGIGAQVKVPLIKNNRLVAFLGLHQSAPRHWTPHEIVLIEETAERIWAAVERARAEKALRTSQERFRLLVEGAKDYAMFLLDTDSAITFWSSGAERVFGWTEEEVIGQPGEIIFTPGDQEKGVPRAEMQTALTQGRALDRRWHIRKDRSLFWADGVLMRVDDEAGKLRGFAKIARDATAEKHAEVVTQAALEAVAQANAALEERVEERTHELSEMSALRQELLRKLVTAQEEERGRISRDLHDDTGQQLAALLLTLSNLKSQTLLTDSPEATKYLEQSYTLAEEVARKTHRLSFNLRPTGLDDMGLPGTLQNYAEVWTVWSQVPAQVESIGFESGARLPTELETTIYRVTQEALTNILKHAAGPGLSPVARATGVSVLVHRQARSVLTIIEDNGPGFDVDEALSRPPGERRLGIFGMQERARLVGGTLDVESTPGKGTTVYLRIPLPAG